MRGAGSYCWTLISLLPVCTTVYASTGETDAQTLADLRQLSITELANLDISSVTKTAQPISQAPAAVYVITHDDILRSGAQRLADILRLAPNLNVVQTTASHFIVTARGFSGNIADQNFANKLLVLIDGRSVYSPLFSGVYWDMQDVVPEDIDRIEVISGPGATLWGANAVNGVINIVTRKAADTQGGYVEITAGNLEQTTTLRYGGTLGEHVSYRVYLRDYIANNTETSAGHWSHDHWMKPQGGFRVDWTPSPADTFTVQGDAFEGTDAQLGAPNEQIDGRNLLARWSHIFESGSSLQIQTYYDHAGRATEADGGSFWTDTYDLDLVHSFGLGMSHQITWGGGIRLSRYQINGTPTLLFNPASGDLNLGNVFAQDSVAITPDLTAIIGLKLEVDPYSGLAPLPSGRLAWKVTDTTLLWAAISRAIRSPTPFDRDVIEKIGSTTFLTGGTMFDSEKLIAYELGARIQPTMATSFSLSAYYNSYDDLRSVEPAPVTFFPVSWGNGLRGETYGFETWGDYQVLPWWRLSASFSELIEHFNFIPTSSGLLGIEQLGDDPENRAAIRSFMNLGSDVTFDAELRYVAALPNPTVPSYVELNANVGWNVTERLRLSLSGFNLLHARHQEFPTTVANAVPRSFSAGLQWRF